MLVEAQPQNTAAVPLLSPICRLPHAETLSLFPSAPAILRMTPFTPGPKLTPFLSTRPELGTSSKCSHIAVAFLQEASVNSVDCDIHLEISQTADKKARRIIVETRLTASFAAHAKIFKHS